jgi:hypothetical protein
MKMDTDTQIVMTMVVIVIVLGMCAGFILARCGVI